MLSLLSVILTLFLSVTEIVPDRERLYLGGDAYSAPMAYQRENGGNWTAYNIGRDYLGSITHIASADGTPVAEYSYDPWGRLRNPQSLDFYAAGSEPELFLGRGFTGHEVLPWFGLVNMNARLCDPLLGRFLSPDPYIQSPDFTQNFNRYSYCLNNPLKYTDESGELILTTAIIVGICVGTAIGAGVGAYQGYKIAERKGLTGSDRTWTIIGGGLIGGVAGGISALTGAYVAEGLTVVGFIAGAEVGGVAGATAGFINGFGMATLETKNPLYGLKQGVYQGVLGGLSGALIGGVAQGISSAVKGNNFWNGSSPSVSTSSSRSNNNASIKTETLKNNKLAHENAVNRAINKIEQMGGKNITKEVTVYADCTRVRVDLAAEINGKINLFEIKSSLTASFTTNQKIAYPLMLNGTSIVPKGTNAASIFGALKVGTSVNNYSFVIWRF